MDSWFCLVTLKNTGEDSVIVTGRLGLSYEHLLFHTMVAKIYQDEREYTEWQKRKARIHQVTPTERQLVYLPPGDSITTEVDVQAFYQMEAGEYEVELIYDPAPVEEWNFVPGEPVVSNRVEVRVLRYQGK